MWQRLLDTVGSGSGIANRSGSTNGNGAGSAGVRLVDDGDDDDDYSGTRVFVNPVYSDGRAVADSPPTQPSHPAAATPAAAPWAEAKESFPEVPESKAAPARFPAVRRPSYGALGLPLAPARARVAAVQEIDEIPPPPLPPLPPQEEAEAQLVPVRVQPDAAEAYPDNVDDDGFGVWREVGI